MYISSNQIGEHHVPSLLRVTTGQPQGIPVSITETILVDLTGAHVAWDWDVLFKGGVDIMGFY